MKRYDKYKATGIEWLPLIPCHWQLEQLRKYIRLISKKGYSDKQLLSVTREQGVIVRDTDSKEENHNYIPEDLSGYKYVEFGQLVINKMKSWQGSYGVSVYEGIVSPAYYVCDLVFPNKAFFSLALRSCNYISFFAQYSKGIRVGQWDLSPVALKSIPFFEPPLAEQEKIVSYLEDKTSKIDEVILAKEKQIKLLQELKDAEIANVITRGLNPDVKMKDSGISWIGQIPEHWKVVRLKAILRESKEKTSVDGGTLLSLSQYTGIMPKDSTNKMGMFEAESTVGYNIVHPGQFVMNIMLAWNGSYAVSDYEGVISPAYCVFNFNVDCEKKYFHYLLRLPAYSGAFKTQSKGIIDSRLRLYPQYFLAFKTIVPPIEEQRLIVDYIESKCNKADSLISDLEAEIDYLKEYKQKLVADCVTGQINVQCEQ